jgi:hypothetical protein
MHKIVLSLAVLLAVAVTVNGQQLALPGTPCADIGVPTGPCSATPIPSVSNAVGIQAVFNLLFDPGDNNLGVFVVPGDVVMFEHPPIGSLTNPNPRLWSDVVRFQNIAGRVGSTATIFPDDENGALLPANFFPLSANAVAIVETQTGQGTDVDFTIYTAGTNTYMVHSDAALTPEPPETVEPEPSTIWMLIGGLALVAPRALKSLAKRTR